MNQEQMAGLETLFPDDGSSVGAALAESFDVEFDVVLTYKDGREETRTLVSDFPTWTIMKMMREYKDVATVRPVSPAHKVM